MDRRDAVDALCAGLPSVHATVRIPYLHPSPRNDAAWDDLVSEPADPGFEPVAPDHPLYVLFSSGTTGMPKPIVHGHGGILLEHLKVLALHADLGEADRFAWFTTTGWMMWNYLVSGLLVGSTVVCFDGDPGWPDLGTLWRLADEEQLTWLGASAPFVMSCRKAGLRPGTDHDLSRLRALGSTGAPLPADGFRWVYDAVGDSVLLSSISGGTDVCTAFVGGCPMVPVRAGEISCRYLGAAVEAFAPDGRSLVGEQGELVITAPMPSMPVGFWGDTTGARYRAAYFERFPGTWCHGDWITITARGSCTITGRSDATLNRGGIRIGTSEIYGIVEGLDDVADSLVVHLEDEEGGGPGVLVMLVVRAAGADADETALASKIRGALRRELSPRHAPDEVYVVPTIPTTLSGKKLEVPVKRILAGADSDAVASRDALRDPDAIDAIIALRDRRTQLASKDGV
jgi:acetoacetyl-CoA synthetase